MSGTRHRSPNFPAVDLRVAVERVKALYDSDKMHAVSVAIVHDRWGYKPSSGAVAQTLGALRAYGLIEDVGGSAKNREIKVSRIGRKIALNNTETPDLLRKSAVKPKVFAHLIEKYGKGELPPDSTISEYLVFHHEPPFNEERVDICIARFKATIAFSKLEESDIIPDEDREQNDDSSEGEASSTTLRRKGSQTPLPQRPRMKTLSYAVLDGDVTVQVPYPMTEASFDMFIGILQLQKPALVQKPAEENEGS